MTAYYIYLSIFEVRQRKKILSGGLSINKEDFTILIIT
jgi:hypothetical protein